VAVEEVGEGSPAVEEATVADAICWVDAEALGPSAGRLFPAGKV